MVSTGFASLDGQSQIRVAGQNRSEELSKKGGMFGPNQKEFEERKEVGILSLIIVSGINLFLT